MSAIELIRKSVTAEVFDYTQLMHVLGNYTKPRDVVTNLLRKGQLVRIRKGLYIFGPEWRKQDIPHEILANLIYGPSVISLEYALSWHGLIPEKVFTITSVSSGRSRVFETPAGRYSYSQQSSRRLSHGFSLQKTSSGNWLLADPLKSLADKICADRSFNPGLLSSFSSYLFDDLRIDENDLAGYCDFHSLNALAEIYATRKIDRMVKFFSQKYNLHP